MFWTQLKNVLLSEKTVWKKLALNQRKVKNGLCRQRSGSNLSFSTHGWMTLDMILNHSQPQFAKCEMAQHQCRLYGVL